MGLVILSASISTFWLADSGLVTLAPATTPSGAGTNGVLAKFTPITPATVTVMQGQGAQVVSGVLLGKVSVAAGFASKIRINHAWLDPTNAGAVLNNPNAWITFGTYYPIHTGACTGSDSATAKSITDGSALCVALNTQATGTLANNGLFTINATMISGYIVTEMSDPAAPAACTTTGSTWCAPSGLTVNQNIYFVIAAIYTPGTTAPGQQSQLTTLSFFFGVDTV